MKVIFTGDPVELEMDRGLSRTSTHLFGKTFPMGAEVDVSDLSQDQLRKLLGNPHFRDASVGGARVQFIVPASVAQAAADAGDEGDAEEAAAVAAHAERAASKRNKKV